MQNILLMLVLYHLRTIIESHPTRKITINRNNHLCGFIQVDCLSKLIKCNQTGTTVLDKIVIMFFFLVGVKSFEGAIILELKYSYSPLTNVWRAELNTECEEKPACSSGASEANIGLCTGIQASQKQSFHSQEPWRSGNSSVPWYDNYFAIALLSDMEA